MLPTECCLVPDVPSQEISGRDGMELGKSLQQPLGLCSFPNPRCSDENHAGSAPESHVTMRISQNLWVTSVLDEAGYKSLPCPQNSKNKSGDSTAAGAMRCASIKLGAGTVARCNPRDSREVECGERAGADAIPEGIGRADLGATGDSEGTHDER